MRSKEKIVLNELMNEFVISQKSIFWKYFIFSNRLDDIIWSLREKGYIISTLPFWDTQYILIRDKKGKYYN